MVMLPDETSRVGEALGVWKLNPARSTLAGNQKSVTLPIERPTGEVFTLDAVSDERASTFSAIHPEISRTSAAREPNPLVGFTARPSRF
jgi:hypothetical protein